jgi:glucose-1-phosphate thymidylyltransferase
VIGIYYFKEVSDLKEELQFVLDNNIINGGEYQINDGIKRMMAAGKVFKTGTVSEWMDCGNKAVTVETNARMLGFLAEAGTKLIADSIVNENATIIEPCFLGENVVLRNCTVGPHVSIGTGTIIENSTVKNSIIQTHSVIKNATLDQAMIGNHATFDGNFSQVSLGDYSELK